jgi:hypothetical protein
MLQKDHLGEMVDVKAEHTNRRKRPTRIDSKGFQSRADWAPPAQELQRRPLESLRVVSEKVIEECSLPILIFAYLAASSGESPHPSALLVLLDRLLLPVPFYPYLLTRAIYHPIIGTPN